MTPDNLEAKLNFARARMNRARVPMQSGYRAAVEARIRAGHAEHGGDSRSRDCLAEAMAEPPDVTGWLACLEDAEGIHPDDESAVTVVVCHAVCAWELLNEMRGRVQARGLQAAPSQPDPPATCCSTCARDRGYCELAAGSYHELAAGGIHPSWYASGGVLGDAPCPGWRPKTGGEAE